MAVEDSSKFNINALYDSLTVSLHDEDDVKLDYYIKSYNELNKFFTLLGTIFGFVSKDLKSKIDIINEFLNGEEKENFETVKKMIEHEKGKQLLETKNYVSGCRTLLRLHRGLEFIRAFLKSIGELNDSDNTSHVCREAYDQTLAKHHPFIIRKSAKLAMYALPTREKLLKQVCGDDEESIREALQLLPKALDVTAVVYERVENLYSLHDLHSLP